jgi:flagellar assembly protein FliH
MAMNTTTKFLFETRFDLDEEEVITPLLEEDEQPEVEEPKIVVPTFNKEELAAAKAEAYATGKSDGLREGADAIEARALAAVEKIVRQLAKIIQIEESGLETAAQEAIHVAVAITKKMFPHLNERHSMGEIERVTSLALEKLGEGHSMIIQVNDELQKLIEKRVTSLAADAGFSGRITISGDAKIATGDCRIQWKKGGATRDSDALWREIDAIIARNIGQLDGPIEEQSSETAVEATPQALPAETADSPQDEIALEYPQDVAPDGAQEEIKPDELGRDGKNF